MTRYMGALCLVALFAAACADTPSPASGPSPVQGLGVQASVADDPPIGTPGASCSSAVPTLRITGGEWVEGKGWKNLVEFRPVQGITSYILTYQRRGDVLKNRTLTGRTSYEMYDFGEGIFSAYVQGNCQGASRSAIVEFSNGVGSLNGPPDPPLPPSEEEETEDEEIIEETSVPA